MTEPSTRAKIAVFVSGGGSNLQALIDASKSGMLHGEIVLVISNTSKAYGLVRAEKENINTFVYKVKNYDSPDLASDDLFSQLRKHDVEYIALAGYLKLLPQNIVKAFKGKIINIHPALLPKYGGKGMYGMNVHKAVFQSSSKVSGPTVHFVDEYYDTGGIIAQQCVDISSVNSPEEIAEKVLKEEHKILPYVIKKIIEGKVIRTDNRVVVLE